MSAAIVKNHFPGKSLNAVIIYDDPASAVKVNTMMERVFNRTGQVALWNVKPWRLDLLNLPPMATRALSDTADAHLIVFALHPAQSTPRWLLAWLEQWARNRQIQEAALAVFTAGDDVPPAPAPELPQFAKRHGLNFIFQDSGLATPEAAISARHLRDREIPEADEFTHQDWGINE